MLTALFSVSFTSCIDNEVSPLVESIYDAQADLLGAQAAVQNAEATLKTAQAAAAQAQATLLTAQAGAATSAAQGQLAQALANAGLTTAQANQVIAATASSTALSAAQIASITSATSSTAAAAAAALVRYNNDTASTEAQRAQAMLLLVAETNLQVAAAQNAMAVAQAQFNLTMASLTAQLQAAGATLATQYANQYSLNMNAANDILADRLDAQSDLANAQLMLKNGTSWAYYLGQLAGDVAMYTATKTNLETAIANMTAYIANPTTPEAIISGLKAQNQMYHDAMDAKQIEMQVQWNVLMAIYDENDVRDEFIDRYEDALDELNYAISEKEDREATIVAKQASIAAWQLLITNYPAALLAKQTDVATKLGIKVTATATQVAAAAAQVIANDNWADATADLAALNVTLALLDASYNAPVTGAIAVYAAAQSTYDLGLPGATAAVTAANAALVAGNAAVGAAQIDYNAKLLVFQANPAGFVWSGGVNGAVGLHADATTATNSYREVNLTDNGVLALSLSPGSGTDVTGTYVTYAAFLADATAGGLAPGDYYNVGGDDVAEGTHADRLAAAVNVLTAAQAAIAGLTTDVTNANLALTNFTAIWVAAQDAFFAQRDLYNNQVALVASAEALVASTLATLTAANTALTAANTALATATTNHNTAVAALATFMALPNPAALAVMIADAQDDIAALTIEISQIQPIIDAKQVIVDALKVEYDSYIANSGVLSSLPADLHARIIAEWQVYWVLEQELNALENAHDLNADLISAYGWWSDDLDDLANYLADLKEDLMYANDDLAAAQATLALAQVEQNAATAYITYLQSVINTLNIRHANALAIAAKYHALMVAALA